MAFLTAVGDRSLPMSPWKRRSGPDLAIIRCCEEAALVPTRTPATAAADEWRLLGDLADPKDRVIARLLPGASAILPPLHFRTPNVLRVGRHCGMRTLADPPVFLACARAAAEAGDFEAGDELCALLASGDFKWSSNDWATLAAVAFVPAVDFTGHPTCPSREEWDAPRTHAPSASASISDPSASALASLVAPCEGVLHRQAALAWTERKVLSPRLDRFPGSLLTRLRVASPPPLDAVASHLARWAERAAKCAPSGPAWPAAWPSIEATQRGVVAPCLALLAPALKRPREEAVVRRALGHAPFLLCGDGGFVLARHVVLELLEDQGSR